MSSLNYRYLVFICVLLVQICMLGNSAALRAECTGHPKKSKSPMVSDCFNAMLKVPLDFGKENEIPIGTPEDLKRLSNLAYGECHVKVMKLDGSQNAQKSIELATLGHFAASLFNSCGVIEGHQSYTEGYLDLPKYGIRLSPARPLRR